MVLSDDLPFLFSIPQLRIARLQFELRPTGPLHFPLERRGNALRGTFGTVFQRTVCDPGCPGASKCTKRKSCAYARLFEPQREDGDGRGAKDAPRPFVFRPSLSSDPNFGPQRPFNFELRLFGEAISATEHFVRTFKMLEHTGLEDQSVRLESVSSLDWMGISRGSLVCDGNIVHAPQPFELGLEAPCMEPAPTASEIVVEFSTPTSLKYGDRVLRVPTFAGLIDRVADRIDNLCKVYEDTEWQADFKSIAAVAKSGETVDWDGKWDEFVRISSKTGQEMPMGGFVGKVVFRGVDPRLWPLLLIGQEIHVGHFAVCGLGWYRVLQGRH